MAEAFWFVAAILILGIIGLVGITAAVFEFIIWARFSDQIIDPRSVRVKASPVVAAVWFLLGMAVLLLLYILVAQRGQ